MDMSEIKTLLEAQGTAVKTAMDKYHGQLDTLGKVHAEVKDEVKSLSEDYAKLQAQVQQMGQEIVGGIKAAQPQRELSAGEMLVKSDKFQAFVKGNGEIGKVRIELPVGMTQVKSTTLAVVGETTLPQQLPGVVPGAFVPLTLRAALPAMPVSTNSVIMLRESAWTNSAAEQTEGGSKLESDITFEDYDVPVRTVAHWLKVSNQLLADAPAIVAYINTRLRDGLAQRIERQLLNGDGTAPNISGFTDSGNFTAYTAASDDLLVDAINRAKYAMWAAGYPPDMVVVNPADWGAMERAREATTPSGPYLYGAPGAMAGMNPFGIRGVLSVNMTAGSFLIGQFQQHSMVLDRSGSVVEMGYVNDDFTKNLVTLRAEERLGLAITRPAAFRYGAFTA
jgi:HK97 family phage major capsid protein